MNSYNLLLYFIILIINLLILQYVLKLEKMSCECSKDWRRDYIKYFSIVSIVIITFMFIIPLITQKYIKLIQTPIFRIIANLISIASLINVYSLFTYSQKIILEKCKCSNNWERSFIYYYSLIIMSIYIFIAASLIVLSLCVGNVNNFIKLNKIK
jgi:hypothetical protein